MGSTLALLLDAFFVVVEVAEKRKVFIILDVDVIKADDDESADEGYAAREYESLQRSIFIFSWCFLSFPMLNDLW